MSVTRWCKLLEVIIGSNSVARYCDHDTTIIYNTNRFEPSTAFDISALESISGFTPNNCSIAFPIASIPFTRPRFLQSAATDQILFKVYFHELDTQQTLLKDAFVVESFKLDTKSVEFNCLSIESLLESRNLNMLYAQNCNYQFGGTFCGVDRSLFQISYASGSFTIISPYQISVQNTSLPPNFDLYQNNGTILLQLNAEYGSLLYECAYRTFTNRPSATFSVIDLYNPIYFIPSDYTNMIVQAGCNKTKGNCDSFNNSRRFGGYPKIAGKTQSLSVPIKQ